MTAFEHGMHQGTVSAISASAGLIEHDGFVRPLAQFSPHDIESMVSSLLAELELRDMDADETKRIVSAVRTRIANKQRKPGRRRERVRVTKVTVLQDANGVGL